MKRILLIIALAGSLMQQSFCQSPLFKMYDYSPQKMNPAYAAIDEYLEIDYIYRKQQTGTPHSFITQNLELKYPILNKYRLWSGVAFGVYNDRLEASDRYNWTKVSFSYAINLPANKYNNITFGLLASYNLQQFNSNGLSTGSQFVEYMGFDTGIPNGEGLSNLGKSSYWGISSGIIWQKLSRTKSVAHELGISLQQINKPTVDWEYQNSNEKLLPTLFIHGNKAVFETLYLKVITEAVASLRKNESFLFAGARYQYYPKTTAIDGTHYDLTTKLSTNQELSVGFQMIQNKLSIGLNYNRGIFKHSISNNGTIEIAFQWRLAQSIKTPKDKQPQHQEIYERSTISPIRSRKPTAYDDSTTLADWFELKELDTTPVDNRLDGSAKAGKIAFLSHLVETPSYFFKFGFDETNLSNEDKQYLSTIVELLTANPEIKVTITGHTDNIGSADYNLLLAQKRAKLVANYFTAQGIQAKQIEVISEGELHPRANNATAQGRAENRRVEVKLNFY